MSVYKLKQAVLLVGAITLLLIAPVISLAENTDTAEDVTAQVIRFRAGRFTRRQAHAGRKCENLC